jgi:hypothetical protein
MYTSEEWLSIESFIYRELTRPEYRKDITQAVREIEDYLKRPHARKLLREMGLLSAGFLFSAEWKKTFHFFRRGEIDSRHYKTPYLWERADRGAVYTDLIHELFVAVRDAQRARLKQDGCHFEEYYTLLPQIRPDGGRRERAYYCCIGELLFWLYAWRLLTYFEQCVSPSAPFETGRIGLQTSLRHASEIHWGNEEIVADDLVLALNEMNLTHWASEYTALSLYSLADDEVTPWFGAVEKYLREVARVEVASWSDLPSADCVLQRAVAEWLDSRVPRGDRQSASATRRWLESHAPAPLLPFYFWIALDGFPKTYFVCPVWPSPLYPTLAYRGDSGMQTPIVGLALCGLSPLQGVDRTLTPELIGGAFGVRRTGERDIVEFLRLLAQPAVELNFYQPLAVEVMELRQRDVIAGIMSRNLSHNFGSHVLANPKLYFGLGIRDEHKSSDLAAFHHYLQARLDFIAAVLSPFEQTAEPLYLVADILEGFVSQPIVMRTLLSDADFDAASIRFVVSIRAEGRTSTTTYRFNRWGRMERRASLDAGYEMGDIIVAVAGGTTGCQAFYAFLENVMRNSVRHGPHRDDEDQLTVQLTVSDGSLDKEGGDPVYWSVSVADNLSTDVPKETVKTIREYLALDLVLENEHRIRKCQGIQEMKACTAFLGGALTAACSEDGRSALVYSFPFAKPVWLGVILPGDQNRIKPSTASGVQVYPSVLAACRKPSYFCLIADDETVEISAVLDDVSRLHTALPYRLVVLSANPERDAIWKREIVGREKKPIQDRGALPVRRVRVFMSDGILASASQAQWSEALCKLYAEWLRVAAPPPKEKWNLCIGFDSSFEGAMPGWEERLHAWDSCVANIWVVAQGDAKGDRKAIGSGTSGNQYSNVVAAIRADELRTPDQKSWLVLDRHGRGVAEPLSTRSSANSVRAYQMFSASESGIFQTLLRPPKAPLSFAFFVYGLIEALLLRVVVFDERVLETAFEDSGERTGTYDALRRSNVIPVSRLHLSDATYMTPKRFRNRSEADWSTGSPDEGLWLDASKVVFWTGDTERPLESWNNCDVVVFHEGLVEPDRDSGRWTVDQQKTLYRLAPLVVRTTGSGFVSTSYDDGLPLLPFNVLSKGTLSVVNKLIIGRALTACLGELPDEERPD